MIKGLFYETEGNPADGSIGPVPLGSSQEGKEKHLMGRQESLWSEDALQDDKGAVWTFLSKAEKRGWVISN